MDGRKDAYCNCDRPISHLLAPAVALASLFRNGVTLSFIQPGKPGRTPLSRASRPPLPKNDASRSSTWRRLRYRRLLAGNRRSQNARAERHTCHNRHAAQVS